MIEPPLAYYHKNAYFEYKYYLDENIVVFLTESSYVFDIGMGEGVYVSDARSVIPNLAKRWGGLKDKDWNSRYSGFVEFEAGYGGATIKQIIFTPDNENLEYYDPKVGLRTPITQAEAIDVDNCTGTTIGYHSPCRIELVAGTYATGSTAGKLNVIYTKPATGDREYTYTYQLNPPADLYDMTVSISGDAGHPFQKVWKYGEQLPSLPIKVLNL